MSDIEKYYNDIIDNLRIRLISQDQRIMNLQNSEYKLESEIERLKNDLNEIKSQKKLINSPNHILSYKQGIIQD